LRYALGIALIAASFAVAQEHATPQQPVGDATGHAQAPVEPTGNAGQDHAQVAAKHGEGHEEAPMPNEIWWKWANFAVLAGGLGYLIAKNAGPFFRSRTEEIQRGIADAAKVRADAEARAAEIESKVGNLATEVEGLRARSKQEIASEGARVQAETQAQIAKVQARAQMEIESASKQARLQLKAYSAQLALQLAEQQVRQKLDRGTHEELANGFIADIRQTANQGQQPGGVH
jgi:F0F1-type ATP synthase membrane subunit b/b'